MKISLPLKLAVFVVLLFTALFAGMFLVKPARVFIYRRQFYSKNAHGCSDAVKSLLSIGEKGKSELENIVCREFGRSHSRRCILLVESLLEAGECGRDILAKGLDQGADEADFLAEYWEYTNPPEYLRICTGYTAVHLAASYGYYDSLFLFLDKGADTDVRAINGKTPLHSAVEYGYRKTTALLIMKGSDVNARCKDGKTPLHFAAMRWDGGAGIARMLVEKGADIAVKDKDGSAPLHYAACNCNERYSTALEYLLEMGSDPNSKDVEGRTPLHLAAGEGSLFALRLLLENGAEINAKDNMGCTLLHYGAGAGTISGDRPGVVEYLLKEGAGINILNEKGMTPLDSARAASDKYLVWAYHSDDRSLMHRHYAQHQNSNRVIYVLRAHGAKTGEELSKQGNK